VGVPPEGKTHMAGKSGLNTPWKKHQLNHKRKFYTSAVVEEKCKKNMNPMLKQSPK
jgi:hypothetical protein